jgi:hypothetical protein
MITTTGKNQQKRSWWGIMGNETRGYEYAVYTGYDAEPSDVLVGSIQEIGAEYDRLENEGLFPVILGHNKRRKISVLYPDDVFGNSKGLEHDGWVRWELQSTLLSDPLSDALGIKGGIDPAKIVIILVISNILKADAERLRDSGRVIFSSISVLESPREEDPIFPALKGAYKVSNRRGGNGFPRFFLSEETLPMSHLLDVMYNIILPYHIQDETKKNVYTQGFAGLQKLAVVKATSVGDLQDIYVMSVIKQKRSSLNDLATLYVPISRMRTPQERDDDEMKMYKGLISSYYNLVQDKIAREMDPSFLQEVLWMSHEERLAWVRDKLPGE